jgi:hypothetical protein
VTAIAGATDVEAVLRAGGYEIGTATLADHRALLAESPYALVAYVELNSWEGITERVFDIQAELTQFAAERPSPLIWDLYLFFHVLAPGTPAGEEAAEMIEADTAYARKLVRVQIGTERLDAVLRPVLPLRAADAYDMGDPLEQLRSELAQLGIEAAVADEALSGYEEDGKVRIR